MKRENKPGTTHDSRTQTVVLFDGECNLCNNTVQFIIRRDPRGRVFFATLGSDAAGTLLNRVGSPKSLPDSIALVEAGRVYVRSAAALRIAKKLRFPWPLLFGFIVVPRPLRDWIYNWVARNRYRWFGRRDECMVPTPELRTRFLN